VPARGHEPVLRPSGIADGTVKIVVCGDGGNGKLKCYGGGKQKSLVRAGTGEEF